MDISTWSLAFDGYAIAAAILGQLTYKEAMAHKQKVFFSCVVSASRDYFGMRFLQVLQIAFEAPGFRQHGLAVVYDQLVRYPFACDFSAVQFSHSFP